MNCTRRNVPPRHLPASVLTVSVFARPGTPSSSTWPVGEERDEQPLEHRVLADDHALDLVQDLLQHGGGLGATAVGRRGGDGDRRGSRRLGGRQERGGSASRYGHVVGSRSECGVG